MINIWRRCNSSRLISGDLTSKVFAGISQLIANAFFEIAGLPVITLQSESRLAISAVTGMDVSNVVFRSSEDCDQWEARADGNGQVGVGLLVGSGGSINANQDVNFDVEDQELTNGDKVYSIDVFGHNAVGWSSRI